MVKDISFLFFWGLAHSASVYGSQSEPFTIQCSIKRISAQYQRFETTITCSLKGGSYALGEASGTYYMYPNGDRAIWLADLYINHSERGAGRGGYLLRAFEYMMLTHLGNSGIKSMNLYAPDGEYRDMSPEARRRFYEKHGFQQYTEPGSFGNMIKRYPDRIKSPGHSASYLEFIKTILSYGTVVPTELKKNYRI